MRSVSFLVVAAAFAAAWTTVHAGACCESFQGVSYGADCNCLEDDMELLDQQVKTGAYVNYHWRLTQWALINVPDEQRPSVTFRVTPCTGDAHLFVTPVVGPPFPTSATARWQAVKESEVNSVTSKIYYGEYFISVYGASAANYSIVAIIDETVDPVLGGNGTVNAFPKNDQEEILFPGDKMAMMVSWTTVNVAAEYQVYASPKVADSAEPCSPNGVKGTCIQSTGCGLMAGVNAAGVPVVAKSAWLALAPGIVNSFEVKELEQNQEYTFNVVVRTQNRTLAYTATTATPTFTRVEQLNSDETVIIVAVCVGALFVLLVGCIVFAKVRLNKAYQVHRFGKKKAAAAESK